MSYLSNHLAPWIDPRVRSVRVAEVEAYLLRRGWKAAPSPRTQVRCFEGPPDSTDEPPVLAMPSAERGSDYVQRIIELLTDLALLEDRYAGDVLTDILQPATPASPRNGQEGVGQGSPVEPATHP